MEDSFKPIGLNRERLFTLMDAEDLDGIFLASPENVFYITGFPALPFSGNPILYALRNQVPYFVFIGKDQRISLLCWGPAAMGVDYGAEDIRSVFTFEMAKEELAALVKEKLQNGCKLGIEETFPFYAYQIIQENVQPGSIVPADELMNRLRLIKSPAEIERIRRSTQIVEQTVMKLADLLRPGMSRLELIREAKTRMVRNGADGVDHVTVAFGAANPEIALDEKLEADQIVTLDLGAVYQGYISDNRRLVYTGKIPPPLKELHEKLCWVVNEMAKALQPGKTFSELHAYAFELYAKADLSPMFLHVGHSMGLQVEERWIMSDDETKVAEGMVLNIELYSLSDEGVMVGDEETFVITAGGVERITQLPPDMIEKPFSS